MLITKANESDLHVTLALDCRAPKRKVFETWTEPEWIKKWFRADEGYVCSLAEVDLRVGGKFALAMNLPGKPDTRFHGTYQVVHANESLVYTWAGGEGDHVTLVTALFSDREKGSRIDFTHGVFATKASKDGHVEGWMRCFKMLERALEET